MNETKVTLVGHIGGGDPEMRFTPSGQGVCKFRMACTPRLFDKNSNEWKDGETSWYTVSAWRDMAENVAETLRNGMSVIVTGSLKVRQYEDKDGNKRISVEVEADAIGPNLARARATVTKNDKSGGASQSRAAAPQQQQRQPAASATDDPWA